jgi:hypothetical protein
MDHSEAIAAPHSQKAHDHRAIGRGDKCLTGRRAFLIHGRSKSDELAVNERHMEVAKIVLLSFHLASARLFCFPIGFEHRLDRDEERDFQGDFERKLAVAEEVTDALFWL